MRQDDKICRPGCLFYGFPPTVIQITVKGLKGRRRVKRSTQPHLRRPHAHSELRIHLDDRRAQDAAGVGHALLQRTVGSEGRGLARPGHDGPRSLARSRRQRLPVRLHARRVRRRRWRLRPRSRPDPGPGRGWSGRLWRLAALGHRRPLHPALRHRRAEEALAAQDGHGRADRRHRHDRARHRLRPARRAHLGHARRRHLQDQRQQDLHHQRPARQPHRRGLQDRQEQGRTGHLAAGGRDR